MSADSNGSRVAPDHEGIAHSAGHPDVSVSKAAEPEIAATEDASDRRHHHADHSPDSNSSGPSSGDDLSSNDDRGRSSSRRLKRPNMPSRKSSGTIIVPRDRETTSDTEPNDYPPDDARAMSPRRNSEETHAMEQEMRAKMRSSARETQLTLLEIAESIELVRQSHNQLQRQNEMLQDYIGGLTRQMSQPPVRAGKVGKK